MLPAPSPAQPSSNTSSLPKYTTKRTSPRPRLVALSCSQWQAGASQGGIDPGKPIDRNSVEGLGALARSISYQYLEPSSMPAAPDARFFPGLPVEGTRPATGPVQRMVSARLKQEPLFRGGSP